MLTTESLVYPSDTIGCIGGFGSLGLEVDWLVLDYTSDSASLYCILFAVY